MSWLMGSRQRMQRITFERSGRVFMWAFRPGGGAGDLVDLTLLHPPREIFKDSYPKELA